MKVIFKHSNEVKEVSFGYAVNYLLPKGLAVLATEEALKKIQAEKEKKKEEERKKTDENEKLFSQFSGKEFTIKVKTGKKGKLHGALTKKDLAKELKINKEVILLPEPIKKIGEYLVELKFGNKKAKVKIKLKKE